MGAPGAVACVTRRRPILLTVLGPVAMPQQLVAPGSPLSGCPPWPCAAHPNWSDRKHRDHCQLHVAAAARQAQGPGTSCSQGHPPCPSQQAAPMGFPAWDSTGENVVLVPHGEGQGKRLGSMAQLQAGLHPWSPAEAPHSPQSRPSGQQACCNREGHVGGMLVVWQSSSLLQGGIKSLH